MVVVVAEKVNYLLHGFFAEPSINLNIQLFDLSVMLVRPVGIEPTTSPL